MQKVSEMSDRSWISQLLAATVLLFVSRPALAGGSLDRQLHNGLFVGSIVEDLPIAEFYGCPVEQWRDLLGQFVLVYEIRAIQAYKKRQLKLAQHFSEFYRLYRDRGLFVLAILREPRERAIEFANDLGITHPIARFDRKDQQAIYKVFGYWGSRDGALIDPYGVLVCKSTSCAGIAKLFDESAGGLQFSAIEFPVWKWPRSAHRAAVFFRRRAFGRALIEAQKIQGIEPRVFEAVRHLLRAKCDSMVEAYRVGNYRECWNQASLLRKEAKGTWEEYVAVHLQEYIRRGKGRMAQRRAQVRLDEIRRDYQEFGWFRRKPHWGFPGARGIMKKVDDLVTKFPGTFLEEEAKTFLSHLKKRYDARCNLCGDYAERCCHPTRRSPGGATPKPRTGKTGSRRQEELDR